MVCGVVEAQECRIARFLRQSAAAGLGRRGIVIGQPGALTGHPVPPLFDGNFPKRE